VETEFLIKTLGLSLCLLVKIKYLPSLVGTIVSGVNLNLLSFNVLSLVNIKAFVAVLDVAEVLTREDEDLPPSRVSAPDLHLLGLS
jgi:hypothetical protein